MRVSNPFRVAAAVTAMVAVGACDQASDVTGVTEQFTPAAITVPDGTAGSVVVCKETPSGEFTFTPSATHNADAAAVTLADEECETIAVATANGASVTVTEELQAGFQLDSISVYRYRDDLQTTDHERTNITTNSETVTPFGEDIGWILVFYNSEVPPPPSGVEGCTPGYWKNHANSWAPTGYSPGQTASSVFSFPATLSSHGAKTLLNSLNGGGGPGVSGAATILMRAAVAALLNSAHPGVDYTRTTANVISNVNDALTSGDRTTILNLATALDNDNNLGCPLN